MPDATTPDQPADRPGFGGVFLTSTRFSRSLDAGSHHETQYGMSKLEERKVSSIGRWAGCDARLRAPMSLQRTTYDAATGTFGHRSKMHV